MRTRAGSSAFGPFGPPCRSARRGPFGPARGAGPADKIDGATGKGLNVRMRSFERWLMNTRARAWILRHFEAPRVLEDPGLPRPGGVFSFGEALLSDSPFCFNRFWRHVPFGRQELEAALREAGLTVPTFQSALLGRWCFVRARK